jgi:hypothetical protein
MPETNPHKKKSKGWGHESEYTRQLREKSLDNVIVTECLLCGSSVKKPAREGIAWFRKHAETARHKRNLAKHKITRSGDSAPKRKR